MSKPLTKDEEQDWREAHRFMPYPAVARLFATLDACRAERDEADHDAGVSGTLARQLLDQNRSLVADLERATKDDEDEVRRGLWVMHGHQGIYGDDGEMQCSECGGMDYKRAPLDEVFRKAWNVRHDDFGRQMREVEQRIAALTAERDEARKHPGADDPRVAAINDAVEDFIARRTEPRLVCFHVPVINCEVLMFAVGEGLPKAITYAQFIHALERSAGIEAGSSMVTQRDAARARADAAEQRDAAHLAECEAWRLLAPHALNAMRQRWEKHRQPEDKRWMDAAESLTGVQVESAVREEERGR